MEEQENTVEETIEETAVDAVEELTEDRQKLAEARQLLGEEQVPAAILALKQALEINPELLEAAYLLGETYIAWEDWENAVDALAQSGDYNLQGTYRHLRTIAPHVNLTTDKILEAMPQDFSSVLGKEKALEDEARKRTEMALKAAREEDEKVRALEQKKDAKDPALPMPSVVKPFLTNTIIPGFLTALSFVFWGAGQLLTFNIVNAIWFAGWWYGFYWMWENTAMLQAKISSMWMFTSFMAGNSEAMMYPIGLFLDENMWSFAQIAYFGLMLIFAFKSAFDCWFKSTKIFLYGYVCELRNNDVWVNVGFPNYVEAGDKFKIYKRTKFLKTVKADATVAMVEDDKSVVEIRPHRDPETNQPYDIQVGDVIAK